MNMLGDYDNDEYIGIYDSYGFTNQCLDFYKN